jgi:hypothetical protein
MKHIFHFFGPFVLTMFIACCMGCYFQHYYKTNTVYKVSAQELNQLKAANKYFIVHTPDSTFSLKNISICGETFSGEKVVLNPVFLKYLNPSMIKGNRFPGVEQDIVLSEVHIYTSRTFARGTAVSFTTDQINRMDIYDLDKSSSEEMKLLSSVGLSLGITVIVGGSFLAAKESGLSF